MPEPLRRNIPLSQQCYESGLKWADLNAAAELLEESKSSYLAQMMTRHPELSVQKAELRAKSSEEWQKYIQRMVEARKKANIARVELDYLKAKFWELNSQQATERLQARI